ncbi:hypothetical protein ACP4OV_029179 [Aristida adscensionis]
MAAICGVRRQDNSLAVGRSQLSAGLRLCRRALPRSSIGVETITSAFIPFLTG